MKMLWTLLRSLNSKLVWIIMKFITAEKPDEKTTRKTTSLKMGLRVIQGPHSPYLPKTTLYNVPFSKDPKQETKKRGTKIDNSKTTSIQQEIISTNGKIPGIIFFLSPPLVFTYYCFSNFEF